MPLKLLKKTCYILAPAQQKNNSKLDHKNILIMDI